MYRQLLATYFSVLLCFLLFFEIFSFDFFSLSLSLSLICFIFVFYLRAASSFPNSVSLLYSTDKTHKKKQKKAKKKQNGKRTTAIALLLFFFLPSFFLEPLLFPIHGAGPSRIFVRFFYQKNQIK